MFSGRSRRSEATSTTTTIIDPRAYEQGAVADRCCRPFCFLRLEVPMERLAEALLAATALFLLEACSPAATVPAISDQVAAQSILVRSDPANGSTVAAPVNRLELSFNPPARLREVIVTGPDGAMPMMVTAVGEVPHYSLPLHGLGPGSYNGSWEATARGGRYTGRLQFTVR